MEQDDEVKMRTKEIKQVAKKIGNKLAEVNEASADLSIYKVPNKLRKVKEDAYNPRLVSIGPFHRGNPEFASMVEHKWRYLLYFVQRTKDDEATFKCLEECTAFLYNQDPNKIRGCYAEEIDDDHEEIDDDHRRKDKLTKLLLLDGCFILELFLRQEERYLNLKSIGKFDPIFNNAWMIPALQQDLALLENQIPFFVLKNLYGVLKKNISNFTLPVSVTRLALNFFLPKNQKARTAEDRDTEDCKHLLHLLHKFYLLPSLESSSINLTIQLAPPQNQIPSTVQTTSDLLPRDAWFSKGASKLLESGVQLQKGSHEDHLLQITFDNGVLKIPPIFIEEKTNSLFRNLIAFEQCHQSSHQITSYSILMKSLSSSKEDFKLLQKSGIINPIWTEEEHLIDFGDILGLVHPKDFCYGQLCKNVNVYSKSWFHWKKQKVFWKVRLRKYVTSFHRLYFSSPWSMIAFLAGVTYFGLTITQTYFIIQSC